MGHHRTLHQKLIMHYMVTNISYLKKKEKERKKEEEDGMGHLCGAVP